MAPQTTTQQPQRSKQQPAKSGITGVIIFWAMFALMADFVGILLFVAFETGDEVACSMKQVCYLEGADWLGYVVLGCGTLTAVALSMLLKANK